MTTKNITRDLVGIFLLTLVVRAVTAWFQQAPINIDEAYHYINALSFAQERTFTENFIWNYLYLPDAVSHPGFLFWMPLTSLIASLGLMVGSASYGSAQWGFILLSSCLPVVSFIIARDVSKNIRHAYVVAFLMIFSGYYFRAWTVTDCFTPFTLAGVLALHGFSRLITSGKANWGFYSGGMVGLANLARPDGPLLIVAFCLVLLSGLKKKSDLINLSPPAEHPYRGIAAVLTGFLVVMAPWYIRNILITGKPIVAGGMKTVWLCNYNDIFSYGKELSLNSYLACGWSTILESKWQALVSTGERLYAEQGLIFALPLAIIGWWVYRGNILIRLALAYGILLFISMTLVFTFPGPRGSWFHSAGILLPFIYIAAAQGSDTVIAALAKRWPKWRDPGTKPFFSALLIFISIVLTLLMHSRSAGLRAESSSVANAYKQAIALLDDESTVMVADTTLFVYYGGWQSIAVPSNGLEPLFKAADNFDARYLLLDKNCPEPLKGIYQDVESHPRLIFEQSFASSKGPINLYRIEFALN